MFIVYTLTQAKLVLKVNIELLKFEFCYTLSKVIFPRGTL